MRVIKIQVSKLFGVFDYVIDMKLEEHITILIAPNGFGKTKILEMLHGLFARNFAIFSRTPFARYEVTLDDGTQIVLATVNDADGNTLIDFIYGEMIAPLFLPGVHADRFTRDLSLIENYAPVRRVGLSTFRDLRTNDVLSLNQVLTKYSEHFPPGLQPQFQNPDVEQVIRRLKVRTRFVRTQRLSLLRSSRESRSVIESDLENQFAVVKNKASLRDQIKNLLGNFAETSRALDATFPVRLINRSNTSVRADFDTQVNRLNALNEKWREIAEVGLLDKQTEAPELDIEVPSSSSREIATFLAVIFSLLVEDSEEKIAVFDELLRKIKLFRELANKRFQFKHIEINKEQGYVFFNSLGNELPVEYLSSGEQHELVLLYEFIFETKSDSLIIVDEPELSLHIAWQEEFLKDLRAIIELTHFDVLIATHSPNIVQGELDLLVDLGAMVTVNE